MIDTPTIDWAALSPYLAILGGMAVIMLVAPFLEPARRNAFGAIGAVLTLAGATAQAIALFVNDDGGSDILAGALRSDRLADLSQVVLFLAGLGAVFLGLRERDDTERRAEYYLLLLSAVGGMAIFVASNDLVSLFLGLEWFSISLYILCAITLDRTIALESGLKYLIAGSFSSALLLFGLALVFGATGEVGYAAIAAAAGDADPTLLAAGLALLLVGLGFKLSAAPFHQWTPDVYEGAPTPVTALMASATKVAAAVLTLRVLTTAFPDDATLWTIALAVLSVASLLWGNLAALAQRDLKRLLAYSSISHAGFLLMPLAAGNELGGRALLYYLIPYAGLTVTAFGVVAVRERELNRRVGLDELAGLGWERPYHGIALAIAMFGFIGLPPMGIFFGKLYAFSALYDRGWVWLMIIGAVLTAVSVYYYLAVVRAVYLRGVSLAAVAAGGSPPRDRALDLAIGLGVVVGIGSFVVVDQLMGFAADAVAFLPFPF